MQFDLVAGHFELVAGHFDLVAGHHIWWRDMTLLDWEIAISHPGSHRDRSIYLQFLSLPFPASMKVNALRQLAEELRRYKDLPVQVRSIELVDHQIDTVDYTMKSLKEEIEWLNELAHPRFAEIDHPDVQHAMLEHNGIIRRLEESIEELKGVRLALLDARHTLTQAQEWPFKAMEAYENRRIDDVESITDPEESEEESQGENLLIPNAKKDPSDE